MKLMAGSASTQLTVTPAGAAARSMPRLLFFQHTPDVALAAEEFFKASIGDDTRRACGRLVKHWDGEGRTVELGIEQARKLFHSVDAGNIVGLHDCAPLGVLAYTGARVGAGRSCIGRLSEPLTTPGCCAASRRAVMNINAASSRKIPRARLLVPRGRRRAQGAAPCTLRPSFDVPGDETAAEGCRAREFILPSQLPHHPRDLSVQ